MSLDLFTFCVIFLAFSSDFCSAQLKTLSKHEKNQYKEKVRSMFYHAYDNYVQYAEDYDELMPISCSGMNTWGTFSLSLIDALDTLAIMGNHTEFRRVAQHLIETAKFDTNTNVSVFETNIRVIGGLLSAHLFSKRAGLQVGDGWPCSGPLLSLAEDVALRLLPAFNTSTGMPYGTVNLLHGVPQDETPITCTAGVGTFIVEFGALSRLTGNPIFEEKALVALDALQRYRSKIGLLGNHIDVQTGKWIATDAGIGAGVDSYYEYLVKGGIMLQIPSLIEVFNYDYKLIKNYFKKNDWYVWVSMTSGSATMPIFQSLEAFFPGLLTLVGEIDQAKKSLYNYHQVWKQYGFVPEFYDIAEGKHHKREGYPLRPEFIESVLYLYQATKDPHLLMIGADVVDSIYHSARTECGYATIKSVSDHSIEDRMESFFLAETLKYLYLLFDEDNFMHNKGSQGTVIEHLHDGRKEKCVIESGGFYFNTEAHPIDAAALSCCHRKHSSKDFYFDNDEADFENFKANLNLFDLASLKKVSDLPCFESLLHNDLYPLEPSSKEEQNIVYIQSAETISEDLQTKTETTNAHSNESDQSQPRNTPTLNLLANLSQTFLSELNHLARNILAPTGPDDDEINDGQLDEREKEDPEPSVNCEDSDCDSNDEPRYDSSPPTLDYELLQCPSQNYLSRLSLYGQMFE